MNSVARENELMELPEEKPTEVNNMLAVIDRAAQSRDVDVDKMRALLDMQKEIFAYQAKADYMAAMAAFGGLKQNIKHNRKGKTAGDTTFGYSDFPKIVKAVTPWLHQCGLSFSHREDPPVMGETDIHHIMVYCTIKHVAGHSEEFHFPAMPDNRLKGKVSPSQLIQMAITYAKRQTLAMGLGLATAEDALDDDGAVVTSEPITQEQALNIQALIEETKSNKAHLLNYLKAQCNREIKTIADIPATAYELAVQLLEGKRKKAAQ